MSSTSGGIRQFIVLVIGAVAVSLFFAQTALAASDYTIIDAPSGGQCAAIGTWSPATKTCTLNRDLTISGANHGIDIISDGVTLDGGGHSITFNGTPATQYGVIVNGRNAVTVKNMTLKGFRRGVYLASSVDCVVWGNRFLANDRGITAAGGNNNSYVFNTVETSSILGIWLTTTNSDTVAYNNLIENAAQIVITGSGNSVFINYFSDYDTRPEGCVNAPPAFDYLCEADYSFSGGISSATVIRSIWDRYDWAWYDDVGGDNWVLLGNRPTGIGNMFFDLSIGGTMRPLAPLSGYQPGIVPEGMVIYNKYPGVMGGPVTATNRYIPQSAITSQRTLWPKGGNSLEEVPGTKFTGLDSRLYWTWYDNASPGYRNWVLLTNPNDYQIIYNIKVAGNVVSTGTIPASGRVTPSFPGLIGGPVEANAWNSFGDPVYIMGSQRVLSNNDMAFNEQPGLPATGLTDNYVWTWYDMTGGAQNWVLVANPPDAAAPIWYEIWIAGARVKNGGPLAPGGNETPTFPGRIGGPVEARCFANAAHTVNAPCIASQRIIWGPSFGEVVGWGGGSLLSEYRWTWYDQASAGAQNWVLVANKPGAANPVYYEVWIGATKVKDGGPIAPGGNDTPSFPGKMGGMVRVKCYQNAAHTMSTPCIASQRVLWNGHFNEIWGQ